MSAFRLTRHGVNHAPGRADRTLCDLPTHRGTLPEHPGRRPCCDCKRELDRKAWEAIGGSKPKRTYRIKRDPKLPGTATLKQWRARKPRARRRRVRR